MKVTDKIIGLVGVSTIIISSVRLNFSPLSMSIMGLGILIIAFAPREEK